MTLTARNPAPIVPDTAGTTAESSPDDLTPGAVRKSAGLTLSEMAALLGMSDYGYAEWENGARRAGGPAYRLLHLIAETGTPVIECLKRFKD